MTEVQMRDYFDLIQDKNSEPYFTDAEKFEFLNAAQMDLFNELIGGNDLDTPVKAQLDERAGRLLEPFIYEGTALTPASNIITYAALKSDIGTTEDVAAVLDVVALASGSKSMVATYRSPRHFAKAELNTYSKGTAATTSINGQANYMFTNTGIYVSPNVDYDVQVVAYPPDMAVGTNSSFPAEVHHLIVAKALVKAGITTEAEAMGLIEQVTE